MSEPAIQQTVMGHGFTEQMNKSLEQNRNALRKSEKRSFFRKTKYHEKDDLLEKGKKMNKSEFMAFSAKLQREQRLQRPRMILTFTIVLFMLIAVALALVANFSEIWSETHNQGPHFHNNDRPNAYD